MFSNIRQIHLTYIYDVTLDVSENCKVGYAFA